jgi:hypothetical protein
VLSDCGGQLADIDLHVLLAASGRVGRPWLCVASIGGPVKFELLGGVGYGSSLVVEVKVACGVVVDEL